MAPSTVAPLRAGSETIVTARMSGDSVGRPHPSRKVGGDPFEQKYPIEVRATSDAGNAFVPRPFAAARIADRERLPATADSTKELVALASLCGAGEVDVAARPRARPCSRRSASIAPEAGRAGPARALATGTTVASGQRRRAVEGRVGRPSATLAEALGGAVGADDEEKADRRRAASAGSGRAGAVRGSRAGRLAPAPSPHRRPAQRSCGR